MSISDDLGQKILVGIEKQISGTVELPKGDASAAPPMHQVPERIRRAETVLNCRTDRIMLVLEQAADEQNEMACLRTAESLGIHRVSLVRTLMRENKPRGGVKPKISKSAQYWLDVDQYDSPAECVESLKSQGYQVWVTDLSPESEMLTTPAEYEHYIRMRELGKEAFPSKVADSEANSAGTGDTAGMASSAAGGSGSGTSGTAAHSGGMEDGSGTEATGAGDGVVLSPASGTGAAAAEAMQDAAKAVTELPPLVAIVMGRESDGVSDTMKELADKRVFLPMWGFTESLNLSVATALVLDRMLALLGPARFGLQKAAHSSSRRTWLPRIAKSPAMLPVYATVIAKEEESPGYIRPLGELRRFASSRQKQYLSKGKVARRAVADILLGRIPGLSKAEIEAAREKGETTIRRNKHFAAIKTESYRQKLIKQGMGDPLQEFTEQELIEEAMAGADDGQHLLGGKDGGTGAEGGTAESPAGGQTAGAATDADRGGPPTKRPRT